MKPFSNVLQFIFGCRHRHLSRVFTIKLRTYRVCFDCARQFDVPSVREPAQPGGKDKPRATNRPYLRTGASDATIPSRGDANRGM
jgi:hypothetical protein